jgi:hypothetical protein
MAKLELNEWLPDLPQNDNPGVTEAKNCIAGATSYREFKGLRSFSSALTARARGSYWMRSGAGVLYNFAGDLTKIYLYGSGTWSNVSQPATTYSAGVWDFTSSQDRVIATDGGGTNLQYFDVGTSTEFADLPGSPPRGKCIGVVRDFVLVGNYTAGSEREAGGIAWCGFNNTALWTPTLSTQAGRRRTRGAGGQVQRIVSGTQGVVLRENSIFSLTYVGAPTIFQVDDITTVHGTPAPRSVCWTKDQVFYYSSDGFCQMDRRSLQIAPIGSFKVDNWFLDNAATGDIVNMQGSVDRRNKLVFWAFRTSASATAFDRMLVYTWESKRWTWAVIDVEHVGEFADIGYNLDTIGAFLGGNIDSASIPMDSDAYSGGALALMGFDTTHTACTFKGSPLVAEIDTTEFVASEGRRGYVNGVRPFVESNTASVIEVAPITRERVQDSAVIGAYSTVNTLGLADLRVNARHMRYRIRITGGFTHASRVELEAKQRGRR